MIGSSTAPLIMLAAGVVFLVVALRVLIQQRRIVEMVPSANVSIMLPNRWDDRDISRILQRYQDQPAVLSHMISSVRTRFILNQDLKTAQHRTKLLASVIEMFKLNRELQGVLHDLQLAEKDFAIRQVEADMRLEDAQARLKSERRLRDLRAQRDELQLNKEITQISQDIETVKSPQGGKAQRSPEEQRATEKTACEARIAALKLEKQNALKIDDEAERVLRVNAIDDAIQREYERWAKLL
jgi:hypothetical protein